MADPQSENNPSANGQVAKPAESQQTQNAVSKSIKSQTSLQIPFFSNNRNDNQLEWSHFSQSQNR